MRPTTSRSAGLLSVGLLAVLLGPGCRLDPGHRAPGVPAGPSFGDQAPDAASLANTAWFDLYQDETLRELIRAALQANPDLGVALARVDEARALAAATGADVYPRLDLSAGAGAVRTTRDGAIDGDRDVGQFRTSFDLFWELDLFGRIRSQTAAARARYYASEAAYRDVTIRLVADVARAYFELRDLDQREAISARTVRSRAEYVDLARIRWEGGKTGELDFRQAESEYFRTKAIHVDSQRQIAVKEHEISILLGHSPDAVPRGREAVDQPLPIAVPAGLPSDLLARRPDIELADQTLASETALVGAARANLYPRIALTGAYGWESTELSDLFTSPSNTASLIAGLLQPIFNAGQNKALVAAQTARMRAAMEEYRRTVLVAFGEVEDGLTNYRRFTEQREIQRQRVQALRRALELAETRYFGGVAQYLEVLDAQREVFDAELEEVDTIQAQLVSLTFLYKALGGGWSGNAALCAPAPTPSGPPVPMIRPAPPAALPPPVAPAAPARGQLSGSG